MNTQHGIRAVPSEGTRFRATSQLLTKDNYTVWAGRVRGILVCNNLWELVTEDRECPRRPRRLDQGAVQTTQDVSDRKDMADTYDAYMVDYNKAAVIICESISDKEMQSCSMIMDDPVLLWDKLQKKFSRKSEAGRSNAQRALLVFEHFEHETAEDTITRFEKVVEVCAQQGVRAYEEDKERSILNRPNQRYQHIKHAWQLNLDNRQTLEQIITSMRDADDDFQRDAAPPVGSAARAEVRTERSSIDRSIAEGIAEGLAKAELLWVQKYARGDGKPQPSRGAAAYTMCYCCGEKGHYARDCTELATAKCNFCRKNGHKEKACKLKQDREESGAVGEASFFHGATCSVVQLGEVFASGCQSTLSTTFLADSGASHHICHDRSMFTNLVPFKGKYKVNQVYGSLKVTHSGTVILEVDGATGKEKLRLQNVLLIECISFNIFSLQKCREADFFYIFKELPGKVVLKQEIANGEIKQLALMTETPSGRMTLDCKILQPPFSKKSCRQRVEKKQSLVCSTSSTPLAITSMEVSESLAEVVPVQEKAPEVVTVQAKAPEVVPIPAKAPEVVPVRAKALDVVSAHAKAPAVRRLLKFKMVTGQDQASGDNLAETVDGPRSTTTPRPPNCTTQEGLNYKQALMKNLGGCRASSRVTCTDASCSRASFDIPSPG